MKVRIPLFVGMVVAALAIMFSCNQTKTVHAGQHSVLLTWTSVAFPGATITYTMKEGSVSGGPYNTVLKTGIAVDTYTDANVAAGNRCYVVVANAVGFGDSNPSKEFCVLVPVDTLPQVADLSGVLQ